jgi:hypothetical protein
MVGSKKKSTAKTPAVMSKSKKNGAKPKKYRSASGKNAETSARFKMITERAKKIRESHPKMNWKNCIRQASRELYRD